MDATSLSEQRKFLLEPICKDDIYIIGSIRAPTEIVKKSALVLLVILRGQAEYIPGRGSFEQENMAEDPFKVFKYKCLCDPTKFMETLFNFKVENLESVNALEVRSIVGDFDKFIEGCSSASSVLAAWAKWLKLAL